MWIPPLLYLSGTMTPEKRRITKHRATTPKRAASAEQVVRDYLRELRTASSTAVSGARALTSTAKK